MLKEESPKIKQENSFQDSKKQYLLISYLILLCNQNNSNKIYNKKKNKFKKPFLYKNLFSIFSGILSRNNKEPKRFVKSIVDLLAIIAQATGLIIWPLLDGGSKPKIWLIPISVTLISCGWWENYTTKQSRIGKTNI